MKRRTVERCLRVWGCWALAALIAGCCVASGACHVSGVLLASPVWVPGVIFGTIGAVAGLVWLLLDVVVWLVRISGDTPAHPQRLRKSRRRR